MKGQLKRLLAIFLVLMLLNADICAIAEAAATLTLPSELKIIDEEAFCGSTSIEKVIVPDGTTEIRSKAFAGSSMTELILPDSLTFIAEDAFEGCAEFALTVPENCYAYNRCVELGLIKSDEPAPSIIESAHPYPDEFDYTWTYDAGEDTESVTIMFSADTETEDGYDFIYIYTLDGVEVGEYSGTQLAGQTVTISGPGFKLRLMSNEARENSNTCYGFKLDSIVPKKAAPLTVESITAESSVVTAGEIIRWTVATTGGKAPVTYDYTVLLGEEEVATGTVEAPSAIEYMPVRAGEYKLSITARDSADAVLQAQLSEAVTVAPSTSYPESEHPYAANTDQRWIYAAEENVEKMNVTFSNETYTQRGYDYIYLYDQSGAQIGRYNYTDLAGKTVEIMGSAFMIRLTSNAVVHKYGFSITNIEKITSGPLSFVSLAADKTQVRVGDLITWTMETEGGERPVTHEYTIMLNGEEVFSDYVVRPEVIEYVPMLPGDYTISVVARDSQGNTLPAQIGAFSVAERDVTAEEVFTYTVINDTQARITGYTGTDAAIIVPETLGGYEVTEIGSGAFCDETGLVSISMPDTVTTVAEDAFNNCDALRSVELGQNVTSVNARAFYDCDALCAFSFPDSVKSTGAGVLQHCDNLAYVNFSANWASAGEYTVADCPKLTKIELPDGLTAVPAFAFRYCANLEEVVLPGTLQTIDRYAFGGCKGMQNIEFPEGLITVAEYAFENCNGFTEIVLPSSVITVNGFAGCSNLSAIELNQGLISIGDNAFESCIALTDIGFPASLERIGINAFTGCTNLQAAILPDSVMEIGNCAFENCISLSEFRYPANFNNVIRVQQTNDSSFGHLFKGCTSLKEITIPEGVTTIPAYTFRSAESVTKFNLPSTLTSIGKLAFEGCKGVRNIDFPANLESIDIAAFSNCTNLLAAILPDTVTGIGNNAFENCISLSEFRYPANFTNVIRVQQTNDSSYGHIFKGCTSLKKIDVPEGVTTIPAYTFRGCAFITEINLPSTLTSIGRLAFEGCEGIQSIDFPANLESIDIAAFSNCTNLEAAILPDSVTGIGNNAFENCTNLSEFRYPANFNNVIRVEMINDSSYGYLFQGCSSLKEIIIPEGVTTIPAYAFRGATSITKVHAPSTLTAIGRKAFAGCTGFEWIYLSPIVQSIGDAAFTDCPSLTIWTEYGAYALQYAINNDISYYYLTPDGVNIPSGVLYRGDEYALYGYARSSVKLTNVTATIWDSTGATPLQSVSIVPGVTDYSLANEISASLNFAGLALGTYRFTLSASTEISEELWANSTFRIVPPPLRVSRIGLNIPNGLYGEGDTLPVAGVISANYPISQIIVGIYDEGDNPTAQVYTGFPNRTAFDLSEAGISPAALPAGSYVFKVIVSGNNETITAVCSEFTLYGAPTIDIDSVDLVAFDEFLADSKNASPFGSINYYGSLEESLTNIERLKYGLYTSDKRVRSGVIDLFLNGIGVYEDRRSEYLVTLYKEEITNFVKTQRLVIEKYPVIELDYEKIVDTLMKENFFDWDQVSQNLGSAATEYEKQYITAVNTVLGKLDWSVIKAAETAEAVVDCFVDAAQNYTAGIQILDAMAADVLDPASWNYNFQLAIRELKDEYTSKNLRRWNNLIKYATDKSIDNTKDELTEWVIKGLVGGEVYLVLKVADIAWTIYTEETGFYEDVALIDKYRAQVETYEALYQNYKACFNSLRNGKSDENIVQLMHYFNLSRAAALRSIETLRRIPMHSRFAHDDVLYQLTNKLQRIHCP